MKAKLTASLPLTGLPVVLVVLAIALLGPLSVLGSIPSDPSTEGQIPLQAADPPAEEVICPDTYEPNDSFGTAWLLAPSTIQSYICTATDNDYYRFHVTAGSWIRLDLYGLSVNCNLCLYDPARNLIVCSSNSGVTAEAIDEHVAAGGDYYAWIYGVQGAYEAGKPYTFRIQLDEPTATPTYTRTPTPTRTRTPRPSNTPTATGKPTHTNTPQPTATHTFTPQSSNTPTFTRTRTPTRTITPTPTGGPDLGDAPDSTNSFAGTAMTAYPGVSAAFPSVFGAGSPPYGPLHKNQSLRFFLGASITSENEADSGPDEDGVNNINPKADIADRDGDDDGLSLPSRFEHCQIMVLNFGVTALTGAPSTVYVNIWLDWNRNGHWGEVLQCPTGGSAPEWAVQNQVIVLPGPGTYTFTSNSFTSYNPDLSKDMWARITLSEEPAPASDGSGPATGYDYGETEDYLIAGLQATATATQTRTPTRVPTSTPTRTRTATPTIGISPTATPVCPDIYEPNDTLATARLLAAGNYNAYICTPTDVDWFKISVSARQSVKARLTSLPANYDLQLYDPFGRLLATSNHMGTAAEEVSYVPDTLAGDYRVRIWGFAGAFDAAQPYALALELGVAPTATPTFTLSPTPTCATDTHEPNNNLDAAAAITPGTEVRGYICPDTDRDYFNFTVVAPTQIRVRLYDLPRNYQLRLYSPGRVVLVEAGDAGISDRELTYVATASGAYSVRVTAGSVGDATRSYALRVDLTDLSPMTLYAEADTYVDELNPSTVHGSERRVHVFRDEFGMQQRALFRFDLTRLPVATISSAAFMVNLADADGGMPILEILRTTSSWQENTADWDNRPGGVLFGISAPVGTTIDNYYQWDVTSLVQDWLNGTWVNHGLELRLQSGGQFSRVFYSREWASGTTATAGSPHRSPKLVINFVAPSPGTLGSIGGVVYHDANGNGVRDGGEPAIADARIELFRDSVSQGEQATDASGAYLFENLSAGSYEVVMDEHSLTASYELLSLASQSVTLAAGEERTGVNFRVGARPTPTPFPTSTVNLRPAGIELVQVASGVEMVRGKRTLARMYVIVEGTTDPVPGINGQLGRDAFDYIDPLAPVDLLPSADPMHDPNIVGDLSRTINFILPTDWTMANISFRLWVNPDQPWKERPGANVDNQESGFFFQFHATDPLHVAMIPIAVDGVAPTDDPEHVYEWLLRTYPLNNVVREGDLESTLSVDYDLTQGGDGCGDGWAQLLNRMYLRWFFGSLDDAVKCFGMLDASVPSNSTDGCGRTPGSVAAGFVSPGSDGGGRIMAHEVGHNLGREHTLCSGGEANADPSYPYAGGAIGVYGVDLSDPSAPAYLDPTNHYDIMSYCSSQWMSDFTYEHLWNAVDDLSAPALRRATSQQEYLVGVGQIANGIVSMPMPFYRLMRPAGTSDAQGTGPYTLELQDASGAALFTRYFDTLADSTNPGQGTGGFAQAVPWQADTARIVIRQGETVLLITNVSAHTPQVTMTSPNGGEVWPPYGEQVVTWTGSDADGDPLRYMLLYSADNGATWAVVADDLTGNSYRLNASTLAGSEVARLRVVASDGVNTAQDDSDAVYTVEGKPPRAAILSPRAGSTVQPGGLVILEGAASDLEDGAITDPLRFTWRSTMDGDLGVGAQLRLDGLSAGAHSITLEVTDSNGMVGRESVTILVGHLICLPLVQ